MSAQFPSESVLMALLALPIAFALLQGLIPIFNMQQYANLFQTSLTLEAIEQPSVIILFVGFAMIVGVLAGAYPALHLSRFDPVTVLTKAGTGRGGSSSSLGVRRGLTVLQFGMALFFTVSAVLLYRQANHAARADYGFDTERLIYVNLQDAPPQAFKQQAQQLRGVESVSMTSKVPVISGVGGVGAGILRRVNETTDSTNSGVRTQDHFVDSRFVDHLGVHLAAAAEQIETAFAEGSSVIINKEAARNLGFGSPAQAIGEIVSYEEENLRIVGVVDNYWYLNPYTYITSDGRPNPLVLRHYAEQFQYALIRTRSGAMDDAISRLQDLWTNFDSLHPLDYGIYEEALQRTTAPMVEGAKLIGLAALLAVLIASVGLLGIASYNVRTRTQEIGIRKALGASVRDVVWLLSKQYLWLVLAAGVIALPLAYWINSQWLADYAHRIEIGWWTPGLSFAALAMLVLAVVGTQTVRAALTNPTESLRDE